MTIISKKPFFLFWTGGIIICLLVLAGIYLFRVQTSEESAYAAGSENRYSDQAILLHNLYKFQPWKKELPIQIAEAFFKANDFDNAAAWFAQAQEISPLDFPQVLHYGQMLIMAGRTEDARNIYRALGTRPNLTLEEILALSREWRNLGDLQESLSTLRTWVSTGNELEQTIAWQIATLESALHPETALQSVLNITADLPLVREKLTPLIDILSTFGTQDAERWAEMGKFFFENKELDLAERAFLNSTGLRPGDSEAWAMLGESRLMQAKDGYPDLVKALRLNDKSRLGRYFLAVYWRDRGQTEVARKYLESLSAEEPRETLWLVELAKTAHAAGDTASALAYFQSAAEFDPENLEIWQALGEFCLLTGVDLKGSCEEAVQKSILLAPDDPVSNDLMGWLLLTGGDPDNALKFLSRSLASDSTSARSHLHLAQALWGVGETVSAREEFQKALALDPDGAVGLTAGRLLERYFPGN